MFSTLVPEQSKEDPETSVWNYHDNGLKEEKKVSGWTCLATKVSQYTFVIEQLPPPNPLNLYPFV